MDLGNLAPPGFAANQRALVNAVNAADRAVKSIGVLAVTGVGTYAVNAARGVIRPAGPPAENPPKRAKQDATYNPYKRGNVGDINNRDLKRQRNIEQLLGSNPMARVYGKRSRSTFKRRNYRSRPARRRLPVRRTYRKTYSKKRSYARKSTVTAARLLASMLK